MHAVQRQPHLGLPPRRRQAKPCTQIPVERDVVGSHVSVGTHPTPQHGTRAQRGHVPDAGVVDVQDCDTRCRQGGHELALGAAHPIEVAQILQVSPVDARHDAASSAAGMKAWLSRSATMGA